MASGDGEHRAREREWCRRATEGLEGLSGVVRTRRTALDGRSRGTAARVSMPLRIRTVRNIQTPNRRFSSPSLGGRPTRVQNLLTAFAVASRPLSPRAPRTPRGPVSHERQLADRSFSRPFHPTCLRRVDRGARPHRLSRIFQSSSDFLVSSSPFSIPRPPLDARSFTSPRIGQPTDNREKDVHRQPRRVREPRAARRPRRRHSPRPPRHLPRRVSRRLPPRRRLRRRTPRRAEDAPPRDGRPGSRAPGAPGGRVEVVGLEGPPMPLHQRRRGQRRAHRRPRPRFRRALLPLALHRPRSPRPRVPLTRCACSGTGGRPRWRRHTAWSSGASR